MRRNIKRASTVVGVLTAAVAMLGQGVAQAAPITRSTICATFNGDYTYWNDGDGWYGFTLTGSITRYCPGTSEHRIWVIGEKNSGDGWYYEYESHSISKGEKVKLVGFHESSGVKNIRITID
ncbi:hypothetical protein ABZ370_08295 [Streptomyces sp. NPDC005962]|uniref:hypothetical protein n=1 Tax=Streptomyces sp. NPDC005962 TaxID=3154466 RepID=UPI0033CCCA7E